MGVLMVGGLLVSAGFAAVDPDISLSREDQDTKQAYGAAEAGLQWYLSRLGQDNSFYVHCTDVAGPTPASAAPVNQKWNETGNDPRVWRKLPGEEAAVHGRAAARRRASSSCVQNNQYSMIDPSGNMRLRISGRSRGEVRTVLATLRRRNFIDFIYFTHFETLGPGDLRELRRHARAPSSKCSTLPAKRARASARRSSSRQRDFIKGPLHTNDSIRVCGAPTFGRNSRDAIEIVGTPAYETSPSAAARRPTRTSRARSSTPPRQLGMPPSNAELANIAETDYRFTGSTEITLNGDSMTVKNTDTYGAAPTADGRCRPTASSTSATRAARSASPRSQTYPRAAPAAATSGSRAPTTATSRSRPPTTCVINGNLTRAAAATGCCSA